MLMEEKIRSETCMKEIEFYKQKFHESEQDLQDERSKRKMTESTNQILFEEQKVLRSIKGKNRDDELCEILDQGSPDENVKPFNPDGHVKSSYVERRRNYLMEDDNAEDQTYIQSTIGNDSDDCPYNEANVTGKRLHERTNTDSSNEGGDFNTNDEIVMKKQKDYERSPLHPKQVNI
jgi:hypothetical protein